MFNEQEEFDRKESELVKTVEFLLPLRQRKLIALKKQVNQEDAELKALHRRYRKGLKRVKQFREAYQACIEEFTLYHTGVVMLNEKLHQTLQHEKDARQKVLKQDADNQALVLEIEKQTHALALAKGEVDACQAEIEKLEYILEQKEDL